jgi:hypothetical protein
MEYIVNFSGGLLAGGLCDDLHMGRELDDPDEQETEPDEL